jgi:hypothetical protein
MRPAREQVFRIVAVSVLFAGPLLCGALFFCLQAPGQDPGVYLETTDAAYTLSGYAAQTGSSAEAAMNTLLLPNPVVVTKPPPAFVIVGTPDSQLIANAPSARLWCFVVDVADERQPAHAVSMPATIRQINPRTFGVAAKVSGGVKSVAAANPRAYRVTSDELTRAWSWGPASLAFQQYHRALARTTRPRGTMDVVIGLEIQDSANGPRRMYSVRVGPPR